MNIHICKVQHYLPIDKLKLHPNNPRTIQRNRLEDLKSSIVEKGFYQPILVWKKGGIILSGNHRYRAVKELIDDGYTFLSPDGHENVLPVVIEDVSEDQATEILFESNNTYAEWIEDKLREAIEEAQEAGKKIEAFGFTQDQIDSMMATAIKDAEEAMGEDHPDYDPTKKSSKPKDEEEYEALILPKPIHEQLISILEEIAIIMNPHWKIGDSYALATQTLSQAIRESGFIEKVEEIASE
jgi:ParB-like chromosome segregation protein Spo0J